MRYILFTIESDIDDCPFATTITNEFDDVSDEKINKFAKTLSNGIAYIELQNQIGIDKADLAEDEPSDIPEEVIEYQLNAYHCTWKEISEEEYYIFLLKGGQDSSDIYFN